MSMTPEQAAWFRDTFTRLVDNVDQALMGKRDVVGLVLSALLAAPLTTTGVETAALAVSFTSGAGAVALGAAGIGAALGGVFLATTAGLAGAGLLTTGWATWDCLLARYLGLSPFQLALSLLKRRRASASVMRPASAAVGSRMWEPTRIWLMLPSAKLRGFLS